MDLGKLTALQLAEKIKQHQISVLDGVKYVFDQIEAKEDKVHAYLDTYKKLREKQLPVHRRSLRILCRSTMLRLLTVWNRRVL